MRICTHDPAYGDHLGWHCWMCERRDQHIKYIEDNLMTGYTKGYNYEDSIAPETEMVSADQADAAIAEAVKKALAETDAAETDTDEAETEQ